MLHSYVDKNGILLIKISFINVIIMRGAKRYFSDLISVHMVNPIALHCITSVYTAQPRQTSSCPLCTQTRQAITLCFLAS